MAGRSHVHSHRSIDGADEAGSVFELVPTAEE
jgi:hypothetical protein